MPDLWHTLQKYDLGYLQIAARLWGLDLHSNEFGQACKELNICLLDPNQIDERLNALPAEAKGALQALLRAGGKDPWAGFARRFGEIREMGAARRDREHPDLHPISASEILYYRAWLARAFFDTEQGPQEFAYIPDDLCALIQPRFIKNDNGQEMNAEPLGRPAELLKTNIVIAANDQILDEATSLLAALRIGIKSAGNMKLEALLRAANLIRKDSVQAGQVKSFLEASRPEALNLLISAWRNSESFSELNFIPSIIIEGNWSHPCLETRKTLLGYLQTLAYDEWWELNSFVQAIKNTNPDFQRPAGDYDSWFIRRASDGEYLRGFGSWDDVDGELIRFFIIEILHWLGMVDLAAPAEGARANAFRIRSKIAADTSENGKLTISSQGKITVPRSLPRAVRYQLARFCDWEPEGKNEYHYQITADSLTKARKAGLEVEHLLPLLARYGAVGIPPILVKALKRWESRGVEAKVETATVLKVSRPEILGELRKSKAGRFLGEPLGPTAITIKPGAQGKVLAVLAEMGLLAEDTTVIEKK